MVYTRKRKNLRRGGGNNNLPKRRVPLTPSMVKFHSPIVPILTEANKTAEKYATPIIIPSQVKINKAKNLSDFATITHVERPVSSRASVASYDSGSESPVVPLFARPPPPAAGKGLLATRGNPPKSRKGGSRKTKKNKRKN